jgi:hypothetical protein
MLQSKMVDIMPLMSFKFLSVELQIVGRYTANKHLLMDGLIRIAQLKAQLI